MRFPWSKRLRAVQEEAEEAKRSIEATKPILDEAVRRTNDSYIAVETETRRVRLELALIHDLDGGWNGNR
jgi:hypothetical protein